jgi:hypothetical protein
LDSIARGPTGTIDKESFLARCRDVTLKEDWFGEDEITWRHFLLETRTGWKLLGILQLQYQALGQQALMLRLGEEPLLRLASLQGHAQGVSEVIDSLLQLTQPETPDTPDA